MCCMYGDAFEHIRRMSANPIQMLKKIVKSNHIKNKHTSQAKANTILLCTVDMNCMQLYAFAA